MTKQELVDRYLALLNPPKCVLPMLEAKALKLKKKTLTSRILKLEMKHMHETITQEA